MKTKRSKEAATKAKLSCTKPQQLPFTEGTRTPLSSEAESQAATEQPKKVVAEEKPAATEPQGRTELSTATEEPGQNDNPAQETHTKSLRDNSALYQANRTSAPDQGSNTPFGKQPEEPSSPEITPPNKDWLGLHIFSASLEKRLIEMLEKEPWIEEDLEDLTIPLQVHLCNEDITFPNHPTIWSHYRTRQLLNDTEHTVCEFIRVSYVRQKSRNRQSQ